MARLICRIPSARISHPGLPGFLQFLFPKQPSQHGGHRPGLGKLGRRLFRPRLTNMALLPRRANRIVFRLPWNCECKFVHEAAVVALRKQISVVGDGIE